MPIVELKLSNARIFGKSLACPLSVVHQWIIVSSLAYEVYDLMTDEVKCFKGDKTVTLSSDAERCLQVRDTQSEDEVIIHRYFGFAINSLVEFKKKKLDQLKGRKNVSSAKKMNSRRTASASIHDC